MSTTPPHSPEDEGIVLSRVLDDSERSEATILALVAELSGIVSPMDFWLPDNQAAWTAIAELGVRGEPPTWAAILRAMRDAGQLARGRVTMGIYLIQLQNEWPHEPMRVVLGAARRLRDLGRVRRGIELCHRAAAAGYAIKADAADAYLSALAMQATELTVEANLSSMLDAAGAVRLVEQSRQTKATARLRSGFAALDRFALVSTGKLLIIAGRPGMGKTQLGLQLARNIASSPGDAAAVFSLEMATDEVVARLMASGSRVNLNAILRGRETEATAAQELQIANTGLVFDDDPLLSAANVRTRVRLAKAKAAGRGRTLRVVVVDYLQQMLGDRRMRSREEQVAEISRTLKLVARSEQVLVVGISQLNREVERRSPPRPQLADLRESGAIEQDADLVALLYRQGYYDARDDKLARQASDEAEVIIAKQRSGPTGIVRLRFIPECCRFEDLDSEPEQTWGDDN